jgi:hypothetical protein
LSFLPLTLPFDLPSLGVAFGSAASPSNAIANTIYFDRLQRVTAQFADKNRRNFVYAVETHHALRVSSLQDVQYFSSSTVKGLNPPSHRVKRRYQRDL